MNDKKKFLFVVEGANREMSIFENLGSVFFNDKSDVIAIPVPVGMNIYMLYDIMKKDDFDTDIVEVLRENVEEAQEKLKGYTRDDFAEIYFFFDFDEHSNNLSNADNIKVLEEMLTMLNNETELGKLYISYPMVEAVRDYIADDCRVCSGGCFRNRNDFGTYKNDSAADTKHNKVKNYDFSNWKVVIANYIDRASCLFSFRNLNREDFIKNVIPLTIFVKEMNIYEKTEDIFILSCLPEFLIDYSENYWNASIGKRNKPFKYAKCNIKKKK